MALGTPGGASLAQDTVFVVPWAEEVERGPCIEDGPGVEDGTQREGQRSEAELQRESVGGEPQRADCKHRSVRDQRNGRTRYGAGDAGTDPGKKQVTVGGDKAYDPVGARLMLVRPSTPDMSSVRGKGNALKNASVG
jgi:hypothetical protein